MKPLDLSKSQVEGLLQQVIQVTLGELCDEAALSKCGVSVFLISEGEEILRHVLSEENRTSFYRDDLSSLAGTAALRAIATFTQREELDSTLVMNYLSGRLGITIQGLIRATLKRYDNAAADRATSSATDELERDFYARAASLTAQREALSAEMSAHFRPKVQALLEANDMLAVRELLNKMPECPMRMIIAGMFAHHIESTAHLRI